MKTNPSIQTLQARLGHTVFDRPKQTALLAALWQRHLLGGNGDEPFTLTLCGSANSGKKHLASALAAALERPMGVFDLQRFADASVLLGDESPLLAFVTDHPEGLVFIEGVEKSPESTQTALLSLLSEPLFRPHLQKNLIFIALHSGETLYRDETFVRRFYEEPFYAQGVLMEHLAYGGHGIDAALLSRLALNPVIVFDPMRLETLFKIARKTLEGLIEPLRIKGHLEVTFEKPFETAALITLFFAPWLNAQRIAKHLPGYFLDTLSREALKGGRVEVVLGARPARLLKACLKAPQEWAWRLTRGNETVRLSWKTRAEADKTVLLLADAQILPRALPPVWQGALKVSYPNGGFGTIPGQKHAKKSLGEILTLLKEPDRLERFGAQAPKGMLLCGPEGVGKAALARAFAAEAGWPCLEASGAALFDEAFLEQLYEKAALYAPAVVLLEELDAKGVVQGLVTTVPSEWLIKRLDQSAKGIFTLATAQEIDEVPDVLRSAGRLDLVLEVPELDHEARKAFLSRLLEHPHEPDIDLERLARMTGGLGGRELEKMVRGCTLEAARRGEERLTQTILIEQINTLKYGHKIEGTALKNYERELEMTAWHEAGHAVISSHLQPQNAIEQVTVAPRAGALGFVAYEVDEKISNLTRQEAMNTLSVLMAGRLAQKRAFGENALDSGAVGDLESATRLAWLAVSTLGLDEELGFLSVGSLSRDLGYIPFSSRIEERVRLWLQRAEEQARLLLDEHWSSVEMLAKLLVAEGVIEGEALAKILGKPTK
ncbi:MAG: AAA family ATPase [Campylobacterales bacterium]